MYSAVTLNYFNKGYTERADCPCNPEEGGRKWYLPHHPALHPYKSDKLLTGPNMVNSLFGVLLRFRQHPYAMSADIESMFHQMKVPEQDRDRLRFLWRDVLHTGRPPEVFSMTVHPFVSNSSPFCASSVLRQALKDGFGSCAFRYVY